MGGSDQPSGDGASSGGVIVNPYEEENVTTDPMAWPSGDFLSHILRTEQVVDDTQQTAEFWQASARRALLLKYNYLSATSVPSDSVPLDPNEVPSIQALWKQVIQEQLQSGDSTGDLSDFVRSRCRSSNRRPMQWSYMRCPPGTQFQLHAHPNIELVYCSQGALHEIRMDGEPYTKEFAVASRGGDGGADETAPKSVRGPRLTALRRPWSFATLPAGRWLVNEVGSVHKSFTATNGKGCHLLVLWGGSHADVRDPPASPSVQGAVERMDRRLCECDAAAPWAAITETFLPDSEKCSALRD